MKKIKILFWLATCTAAVAAPLTSVPALNVIANEAEKKTNLESMRDESLDAHDETNVLIPEQPAFIEGWNKMDDGNWFYVNDTGSRLMNTKAEIDGQTYFFNKEGMMIKGWLEFKGVRYFADNSGAMKKGWLFYEGNWYYMNQDGSMGASWKKDAGRWYYLDPESGKMKTGWLKENGTWYFLDSSGAMKTGWLKDGNKWYYFNDDGSMAKGWIKVDGKSYYLTDDGSLAVNTWIADPFNPNTGYYVNYDGVWTDTSYNGIPNTDLAKQGIYVGPLDEAPENTAYGFLAKKNGKYGLLQANGSWLVKPEYDSVFRYMNKLYFSKFSQPEVLILDENGFSYGPHPGLGGAGFSYPVLVNGKLMTYSPTKDTLSTDMSQFHNYKYFMDVREHKSNSDDLYLWSPVTNKLFGPYKNSEVNTQKYSQNNLPNQQTKVIDFGAWLAVKQNSGTWTLYTSRNLKSANGFERFKVNGSIIGWKKDGSFDVYNRDLMLEFTSSAVPGVKLQDVTGTYDKAFMGEYDNTWYIFKLN